MTLIAILVLWPSQTPLVWEIYSPCSKFCEVEFISVRQGCWVDPQRTHTVDTFKSWDWWHACLCCPKTLWNFSRFALYMCEKKCTFLLRVRNADESRKIHYCIILFSCSANVQSLQNVNCHNVDLSAVRWWNARWKVDFDVLLWQSFLRAFSIRVYRLSQFIVIIYLFLYLLCEFVFSYCQIWCRNVLALAHGSCPALIVTSSVRLHWCTDCPISLLDHFYS